MSASESASRSSTNEGRFADARRVDFQDVGQAVFDKVHDGGTIKTHGYSNKLVTPDGVEDETTRSYSPRPKQPECGNARAAIHRCSRSQRVALLPGHSDAGARSASTKRPNVASYSPSGWNLNRGPEGADEVDFDHVACDL